MHSSEAIIMCVILHLLISTRLQQNQSKNKILFGSLACMRIKFNNGKVYN